MSTYRHQATTCPGCAKKLDASSGADGVAPKPGDCSICWYCGAMLLYQEDLTLRPMTNAEKVEHLADPDFRKVYRDLVKDIDRRERGRG